MIGRAQAILASSESRSAIKRVLFERRQRPMSRCCRNNLKGGLAAVEDEEGSPASRAFDDSPKASPQFFGVDSLDRPTHVHLKMNFIAHGFKSFYVFEMANSSLSCTMAVVKATCAFIMSILLCVTARAELKWEQTQIELHPAAGAKEAVGHFKYKNVGDQPVRIKSVKSSCGCTTAQTQKDQIAPGDSGEITATFKIGDRTGTQIKSVTVATDDPANANTVLILKSVISQPLEIKPAFVFWQMGDAPNAKTITVTTPKENPVAQIKVKPSNDNFRTNVTQVRQGQFKIDIQPRETSREMFGTIMIQPENASASNPLYITARVMKGSVSSIAP
jgi:hypothetical protein